MIQKLAQYPKQTALTLLTIFYFQFSMGVFAATHSPTPLSNSSTGVLSQSFTADKAGILNKDINDFNNKKISKPLSLNKKINVEFINKTEDIGGPSAPEATSFKPVGSDNLVNLFSGDFSYSIPLLDVGGYPVNLFYNGGITMEQEASWAGLGWNINAGSVTRNMRGVPDDFNGEDLLIQRQNTKPNRTWGGEIGADLETIGLKTPKANASVGLSYNNYLGPAIEIGAKTSIAIANLSNILHEKSAPTALSLNLGVGAKLNSRSGITFSPSLNAKLSRDASHTQLGIGLSTSYNSRTGIKSLNLHSELSYYKEVSSSKDENGKGHAFGLGLDKATIGSCSFSFAKPTYMPVLKMPMENANYSGQLEFGGGIFGLRGSLSGMGYYSESKVPDDCKEIKKPLVGFIYSEKAYSDKNAVMDFNRINDAEVTPNTPVISAPQYAYDIFSIQGEGTGGTIRAYRGDLGFMRDNVTNSRDKNISLGVDIAPPGHYGGNWNIVSSPTRVGGWEDANNTLLQTMTYKAPKANQIGFENVYFRNPGEATVTNPQLLNRIGDDDLVRFKLGGSNINARLESSLEKFNKKTGTANGSIQIANKSLENREKRTQVITMLTAQEASDIGLDKSIENYSGTFTASNTVEHISIPRVGDFRKQHHISEIDVLEQSGMRYVYGLPVYNIVQKYFTFSVGAIGDAATNIVQFQGDEPSTDSKHMQNKSRIDGYFQSQETPAYASSFLLTGLISPDYVDVNNDGITEEDLGNAVKFNYQKSGKHKWRTPRENIIEKSAHFNAGLKTNPKDNKATITYGEREVWYMNSIESKSMIAIFTTENRRDVKGVMGEFDGTVDPTENANKLLKKIDLYTKADIKANGLVGAKPIKTVNFDYSYDLCVGTPDNSISTEGKLTLKSVYFNYNGQARASKDRYVFNYVKLNTETDNPAYKLNASDRWGSYKNPTTNPNSLTNADYPYSSKGAVVNNNSANAWNLKKILLPSGGQLEVEYESDDYAYVQNRRACDMYQIYGLGTTPTATTSNALYNYTLLAYVSTLAITDNYYTYVKVPKPITATTTETIAKEIYNNYLKDINQLAFKLQIDMPRSGSYGPEPLTVYTEFDEYGLCPSTNDIIYIKLKPREGKSPLAKSAINFLVNNLPAQAFTGYDVEIDGIAGFIDLAVSMLQGIRQAFMNVDNQMREAGKASTISLDKSFVRLNNPYLQKYGGGGRVKKVLVRDNWKQMTGQFTSVYGQEYDYSTTEVINNKEVKISSGVASYEPGIGSEENPFREILSYSNKLPLASAEYGAIEMPMLEALYPSPSVGYSKVTVRSIHRNGTHGDSAVRSAIGKQVSEFYTAKDYPTFSSFTTMSDMTYNKNPFFSFFYKEIIDRRTLSQGFLVETNDMHGKMKSQAAYSEADEKNPLSYSFKTYKNTGKNGFNDKVKFINNDSSGKIEMGNIGIDVELMTDVREFKVQSDGFNGQAQVDIFPIIIPITVPTIWAMKTYIENKYRAVTCTKLINYHAIIDSVIVIDKGSQVGTKTIAYDAETGTPIVSQTFNEFNDPIYNTNYPAYWAYSGMSGAYKNIGTQFKNVSFIDGQINLSTAQQNEFFESGDELHVTAQSSTGTGCIPASANAIKIWAFDTAKNSTALTQPNKNIVFMDAKGAIYNKTGVDCKIIRSGKRNSFGAQVATATTMINPIQNISGALKLAITTSINVVSASAIEYKEKWKSDNDVFRKYITKWINGTCTYEITENCYGFYEKSINPYLKGLLGNYKPYRSYVYDGDRYLNSGLESTNIRNNGYIYNFSNFWNFNSNNNLVPNYINSKWVWNSELTKINSKGQELETKDPLGRYTSVQYGFAKNMPIAMTQNAKYGESFAEGFEDYKFKEYINKIDTNKCIDLLRPLNILNKNSIVSNSTSNGNAHSGNRMLKVNARSNLMVSDIKLPNPTLKDNYDLVFTPDTLGALNDFGFDFIPLYNCSFTYTDKQRKEILNGGGIAENDGDTSGGITILNPPSIAINIGGLSNCVLNSKFPQYLLQEINLNNVKYDLNHNIQYDRFLGLPMTYVFPFGSSGCVKRNFSQLTYPYENLPYSWYPNSVLTNTVLSPTIGLGSILTGYKKGFYKYCFGNIPVFGFNGRMYSQDLSLYTGTLYPVGGLGTHTVTPGVTRQYFEVTNKDSYNFVLNHHDSIGNLVNYAKLCLYDQFDNNLFCIDNSELAYETIDYGDTLDRGEVLTPLTAIISVIGYIKQKSQELCPGRYRIEMLSYQISDNNIPNYNYSGSSYHCTNQNLKGFRSLRTDNACPYTKPITPLDNFFNSTFSPSNEKKMLFSAWVRQSTMQTNADGKLHYANSSATLDFGTGTTSVSLTPSGNIIEGWQKIEGEFTVPASTTTMSLTLNNSDSTANYWDDIRIHPYNANMKSYVYDDRTLRLSAELDENNYASFYEYDEEGQLVRVKKETSQGIKTIKETRSSKQKAIKDVQ